MITFLRSWFLSNGLKRHLRLKRAGVMTTSFDISPRMQRFLAAQLPVHAVCMVYNEPPRRWITVGINAATCWHEFRTVMRARYHTADVATKQRVLLDLDKRRMSWQQYHGVYLEPLTQADLTAPVQTRPIERNTTYDSLDQAEP